MFQDIKNHVFAYLTLLIIVIVFVGALVYVWPDRMMERWVIITFSLTYFFWGIVTHVKTKKITRFVVEEYLAVATLGGLILLLLTF